MFNISKYTKEELVELAFTGEEREELRRARELPIIYDEDCPPVTPERARNFHRRSERHR